MHARVLTWWTILRICLEERMIYRGDFALGTLMRFLPIVTQIFLWGAIFANISSSYVETSSGVRYNGNDIIAYYLLVFVGRAFSSMPGLAGGIARDIRDGTVKKFLIQPIDMVGFLLLNRTAHKLVYYGVAIAPFALVFYLCRGYFPAMPDAGTILCFAASLVLGFLLGFFMEATIGMIGFWWLEVTSLLFVYMLFSFFFSGHMFPLDMLPPGVIAIMDYLPFKFLAYFPAAVWLQKTQGLQLIRDMWILTAWVAFFMIASRVTFHRGVKRYSGYGG